MTAADLAEARREVESTAWALEPQSLRQLVVTLGSPTRLDIEVRGPAPQAARGSRASGAGGTAVAVMPIMGRITPRPRGGLLGMLLGGTNVQELRKMLRQAVADDDVGAIVLDVDSPGGSVDGMPELAAEIRQARDRKPIVAVANTFAASGAYWLASQATELFVSPSGQVGSIGVYATHVDYSAQNAQRGLKVTLVAAGKHKLDGHPDLPLPDSGRESMQKMVDAYYDMFVIDVAEGRDTSPKTVRGPKFGQGGMLLARDAVRNGVADREGTLDDAVYRASRLAMGGRSGRSSSRASGRSRPAARGRGRGPGAIADPKVRQMLRERFRQEGGRR